MDILTLARVLRARAVLGSHDHWSRDELSAHQARGLRDLRAYALARSPFYRELHRGLDDAPLAALPVVTKGMLMERFDDLVTDRDVRLADVDAYLADARVTDRFRGRYRVAATGGTTGYRGIFLADPAEFRSVVASYARASAWAGAAAGVTSPVRMAVATSRHPAHQSSLVGEAASSPVQPTIRLDASDPIDERVAALNRFGPDAVVAYPSVIRVLADEQLAGRLAIRPRAILLAGEVLPHDVRVKVHAAFGVTATNVYAATEVGVIASECQLGTMHCYDDLVISEVVDENNCPVASGDYGAKVLVTVLHSRTQPLIRYELSDRAQARDGVCSDGRPYGSFGGIEGREEELLTLAGATIHPNVFHSALETVPAMGWQVVEQDGSVRIVLAQPSQAVVDADVAARVAEKLAAAGARDVRVSVERVHELARTPLGKAPLIRHAASNSATSAA